jgi:hypothetical protein
MVREIADHTEHVPEFPGVLARAATAGGACIAPCPGAGVVLLNLGTGAGIAAEENPGAVDDAVEGLVLRLGETQTKSFTDSALSINWDSTGARSKPPSKMTFKVLLPIFRTG